MILTRDFFEENGWKKSWIEVENTKTWCATLKNDLNKDGIYTDLTVTNILYPNRFAVSGHFSSDCYINVMLYTEDDYKNLLEFLNNFNHETI